MFSKCDVWRLNERVQRQVLREAAAEQALQRRIQTPVLARVGPTATPGLQISAIVTVSIPAVGEAGALRHWALLAKGFGIPGAAAGRSFGFNRVYEAVLIDYPTRDRTTVIKADALIGHHA